MTIRRFQTILAAIACAGAMCPQLALAVEPVATASSATTPKDVALRSGGLLVGQVIDKQGAPRAGAPVVVLHNDQEVINTTTDADGIFAAQGLRGGQYQILTPEGQKLCRLWAANTAPPSAANSAVVVTGDELVRGQWSPPGMNNGGYGGRWLDWVRSHPYITAGVVAAAIATPIAIAASDDDDDGPNS